MPCRPHSLVLGLALLTAFTGCSASTPTTVPASGKIVFRKGKPFANATVQFVPLPGTSGIVANGTTDANGDFQMKTYFDAKGATRDGAMPGKYKVVITPYPHGQRIHKDFGSPVKTPLEVDIPEAGNTKLQFEVYENP